MRTIAISCSFITLLIGASGLAYAQDKAAIEKKLTEQYTLTQPTAANDDIVIAGSILVLQKNSIVMAPVSGTDYHQKHVQRLARSPKTLQAK